MQKIALAKKVYFEEGDEANRGKMIIEPCFPGYGITLGNALRRVMLSSLPGAAPIGIKIKGVDHEFMTLPHLKEDILEFIMNLKELRLKMHTDEPVKLELKIHGEKEITAGDIKSDSNVEIINKDLVLGHITDMAGSMEAEITVQKGMGYEMIENREEATTKEIGYIDIDAIYSPVLLAGIKVDNVRVGKMTNWEKIVLDIKTDGTINPETAFADSVKILIDQFGALVEGGAGEEESSEKTEEEPASEEESEETTEDTEEEPKKKRGRPKKED